LGWCNRSCDDLEWYWLFR